MTLIAVYNSDGCVGRCDAKCYNANHPHCDCICGGANHGAGKQAAIDNTRELSQRWIDDWNAEHPGMEFSFKQSKEVSQLSLF